MTQATLTRIDGSTIALTPRQQELFWEKVQQGRRCHPWTGYVTKRGYGIWSFGRDDGRSTSLQPHRVAYELMVGPIPAGLTIDHLCRNKLCCNPRHLEPVTALENYRRAIPYLPEPKRNHGASLHKRERVDGSTSYRVHYRLDGKQRVLTYGSRAAAEGFVATARLLGVQVALAERSYLEAG